MRSYQGKELAMVAWENGKLGKWWVLTALLVGLCPGCGGKENNGPTKTNEALVQPPAVQVSDPPVKPAAAALDAKLVQWLHQPFKQAVLLEPPDGVLRPPDKTVTGKSVGKIFEAVAGPDGVGGIWDQIRFVTPEGKRLQYTATLKTDLGDIKIELWPDLAPNHVRNFLALAKVGYYDGLAFDRTVNQETPGDNGVHFKYLEGGCPLGTGELEYGSIGYWMKPEVSEKVAHEDGIIGAWHGLELESAACKFYITLSKAPGMDGNYTIFGKMIQGLDVAHRIAAKPVRDDDDTKDRPRQPVVIRSVHIDCTEVDAAAYKALP